MIKDILIIAGIALLLAAVIVITFLAYRYKAVLQTLSEAETDLDKAEVRANQAEDLYRNCNRTREMTEQELETLKQQYGKVSKLAYTDMNSDLPNSRMLTEAFDKAIRTVGPSTGAIGVAMFEFRNPNESGVGFFSRSHAELKQEMIQRLKSAQNEADDLLVSMTDNAFALMTEHVSMRKDYEGKIDKLFKMLTLPLMSNGVEILPVVYGAVTIAPTDGNSMQLVMMNLGLAMDEAMTQKDSTYCFYKPDMAKKVMDEMERQGAVTEAIRNDKLEYLLTPQVNLASGRSDIFALTPMLGNGVNIVGSELLKMLDNSGMSIVVYENMLRKVCEYLQQYTEQGYTDICITVPVTDRMFQNREFIKTTYDVLQNLEIDMQRVRFELTACAITKNPKEAADKMRKMTNFGVRFVLKTEGIPEVPAWLLMNMPIAAWKLTKVRQDGLDSDEFSRLLSVYVNTAHSFRADIICSGVDDPIQEELLRGCGMDYAEGRLYGGAMTEELIGGYLAARVKTM